MNRALSIALLIIVGLCGGYVVGRVAGRYSIVTVGLGSAEFPLAYRLDRWTGNVWLIRGLDAYEVKKSPLPSPTDISGKW